MKFNLTNQDSSGRGKNCTWVAYVTGDGIEYSRKGIYNSKNHIRLSKGENVHNLARKMGRRHPAWQLASGSSSVAR